MHAGRSFELILPFGRYAGFVLCSTPWPLVYDFVDQTDVAAIANRWPKSDFEALTPWDFKTLN
jgi:hypothetical protein